MVDTNVLVYAADRSSPAHERCRSLLDGWREQATPWYVTWAIVYEFLRVVTHPRVFRRPWSAEGAWTFVSALLATDSLEVLTETGRHGGVVGELLAELPEARGNLFHDLHTAALMREHGIKVIYTRDTDFHRFPGIEVVDPLKTRTT